MSFENPDSKNRRDQSLAGKDEDGDLFTRTVRKNAPSTPKAADAPGTPKSTDAPSTTSPTESTRPTSPSPSKYTGFDRSFQLSDSANSVLPPLFLDFTSSSEKVETKPEGTDSSLAQNPKAGSIPGWSIDKANGYQVTKTDDGGFVVTTEHRRENPSDRLTLRHVFPDNLEAGQTVHLRFFARCNQPNAVLAELYTNEYPYPHSMNERVQVTPDPEGKGQYYDLDCVVDKGQSALSFKFGEQAGSVEIKDVSMEVMPPEHAGQHQDQNLDRPKGDFQLQVVDHNGRPVPDVRVQLEQKFLFGTQVQGLNPNDNSAEQKRYQSSLAAFNAGTLTEYWPQELNQLENARKMGYPGIELTSEQRGQRAQGEEIVLTPEQKEQIEHRKWDKDMDYMRQHSMEIKIHPVEWPIWTPEGIPSDAAQAQERLDQHLKDEVRHALKEHANMIEINEFSTVYQQEPLNRTSSSGGLNWVRSIGPAKALEHALEIIREEDPDHTLKVLYNDYQNGKQETDMLDQVAQDHKLHGTPFPDAIGTQMHMDSGNWPLERVNQVLDRLSKYDCPIYITEISVLSGAPRLGKDKQDSDKDPAQVAKFQQQQAAYVQKLYQTLYSNPHVQGITWWDLTDKNAWMDAPRGLLDQNNNPKLAFYAVKDFIGSHLSKESGTSALDGTFTAPVYAGNYKVTVTDKTGIAITQDLQFDPAHPEMFTIRMPQPQVAHDKLRPGDS